MMDKSKFLNTRKRKIQVEEKILELQDQIENDFRALKKDFDCLENYQKSKEKFSSLKDLSMAYHGFMMVMKTNALFHAFSFAIGVYKRASQESQKSNHFENDLEQSKENIDKYINQLREIDSEYQAISARVKREILDSDNSSQLNESIIKLDHYFNNTFIDRCKNIVEMRNKIFEKE